MARAVNAMWVEWRPTLQTGLTIRQQRSLALYRRTRLFRVYHPAVVWGTLQTAEYIEAVFRQVVDFQRCRADHGMIPRRSGKASSNSGSRVCAPAHRQTRPGLFGGLTT